MVPAPKPVTADVSEAGAVIVPDPLIKVHNPVPVNAVFPANVEEVEQSV